MQQPLYSISSHGQSTKYNEGIFLEDRSGIGAQNDPSSLMADISVLVMVLAMQYQGQEWETDE